MKIGIIGVGAIGGTIARKLIQSGHNVKVANAKGVEGVRDFALEIGAEPADIHSVVKDVEVVILSIPLAAIASLPKDLFDKVNTDAVVVDSNNYYPGINHDVIEEIENGMVESRWTEKQIGRPVIKAFNMLLANSLANGGKPVGNENRLAMLVAGDDETQKSKVMQLVNDMGFDPVDNGGIDDSWSQQPNSPGYCCDYTAEELLQVRKRSIATKESVFLNHKRFDSEFTTLTDGDYSHDNVIRVNRMMNK
ncbi:NADPH-dependent F420 reductase [Riemerella columbina]|uniref:NADPH-dependent F420 reductase n=1 Tax=Riemerella columbina TaxID=103810 RepID=UPI00036582CF|nr:NAD(P)-binding domain-containing protein [Riemerella columbina]